MRASKQTHPQPFGLEAPCAIQRLFDKATDGLSRFEEKYGEAALSRYVDFYLSPRHRDDLSAGCPIPMLSADVSRTSGEVKAAFDAGLDRLTERLGQQFLVENKPGASGNIGTEMVAKSAPDGYNVVVSLSTSLLINQFLYTKMAYNPQKDLPFGMLMSLAICTVLYIGMAAVMTGLTPYTLLGTDAMPPNPATDRSKTRVTLYEVISEHN